MNRKIWIVPIGLFACATRGPEPKRIVVAPSTTIGLTSVETFSQAGDSIGLGARTGTWSGPKLSTTPEVVWSLELEAPVVHPLALCVDRLYAVAGERLAELTLDGSVSWMVDVQSDGPAVCIDSGILIATKSGSMRLLDAGDGSVVESYGGFATIRTPALPLENRWAWVERDGVLLTKDSQNGPMLQGPVSDGASVGSDIIVGNIYGNVSAFNERGLSWMSTLPGPVTGQPVVLADKVFVPYGVYRNRSGGITAIRTATGERVWSTPFGPGTSAPPSVGQFLIVPSRDGDLVALDPGHGGTRWRIPRDVKITTKPAIVGDHIYVGDGLGRLFAYDMADGGSVWMVELGAPITGDPVVVEGMLVVGTADGRVLGLRSR